jgi:hypothetical protein
MSLPQAMAGAADDIASSDKAGPGPGLSEREAARGLAADAVGLGGRTARSRDRAHDGKLNPVVVRDFERARAAAIEADRNPLWGPDHVEQQRDIGGAAFDRDADRAQRRRPADRHADHGPHLGDRTTIALADEFGTPFSYFLSMISAQTRSVYARENRFALRQRGPSGAVRNYSGQ